MKVCSFHETALRTSSISFVVNPVQISANFRKIPYYVYFSQACFKIIEAAGGYVLNESSQLLVFYRRGSWDIPKGKIDPGETPEQAALREVMEETGLQNLSLGDFMMHTWHTYVLKGERILKKTWWYRMQTTDHTLIPQTEEDITEICWVNPAEWLRTESNVYPSIKEVIETGIRE